MKKLDILIAHPLKHHVFNLAAGCEKSGLNVCLLVPLYRTGLGATISHLPGAIGRKAQGYFYEKINKKNIFSPIKWQIRRLLISSSKISSFEEDFDNYVAELIDTGKIETKVLVTMQDYMPATVRSALRRNIKIWSDQILNRSEDSRDRIDRHLRSFKINSMPSKSESDNNFILKNSSIVTAPSSYVKDGIFQRIPNNGKINIVPYGVNDKVFVDGEGNNDNTIRIIARANSIRKGGHLLLEALKMCSVELIKYANGKNIEILIIGAVEDRLKDIINNYSLPSGISLTSAVVPHVNMPKLLATMHLFVMPSLSEGMSLICLEAMQMGLPIIVTPYCGIDDVFDRKIGVEVQDSADSLKNGLIYAFSNLDKWAVWGESAKKAVKELTWNAYEEKISVVALANVL